jgi:D-arabinose 1-dehydrogenase-like Zn-dependent alcohol dehydrogenase
MRTFYLKDLMMIGCTAWDEPVFTNLVSYIENGEVRPLVAKVFPLERIADAQREFLKKKHVGKFVLIPPAPGTAFCASQARPVSPESTADGGSPIPS